jgi:hypothetical protein
MARDRIVANSNEEGQTLQPRADWQIVGWY